MAAPQTHGRAVESALSRGVLPAVVAGALFWLAYHGGTYDIADWSTVAIVAWCALGGALVLRVLPIQPVPTAARAVGLLFAGFAAFTGISAFWASGAESPYQAMGLSLLYVGVFAIAVALGSPGSLARWTDGLAIGIVAIAVLALGSRLFPGHLQDAAILRFLPDAHTRLSYPIGYWNGLAIFAALACPLLLRAAVDSPRPIVRGFAVAPLPVIVAVVYLASSRTGAATVVVGSLAFIALSSRRLETGVAAAAGALAAVCGVAFIQREHALVNGPLDSAAAARQGWHVAIAIVALGLAAAAVHLGLGRYVSDKRVPRNVARASSALVAVALLGVVVASHPIRHWQSFTRPPAVIGGSNYIQNHFLSTNGNWRWQYWQSAVDEFRAHPLLGGGAGSYEAWWSQHGRLVGFIGNAHSLYFNTLGELGLIGLLLVVATFALAAVAGVRRTLRASRGLRNAGGAAVAGFIAFAVATGLDWMWELPVVGVLGAVLLGLAVGPSTISALAPRGRGADVTRAARLLVVMFCVLVAAAEVDIFAGNAALRSSRAAAAGGHFAAAESAARKARMLAPWTDSPYVQLALVQEASGKLREAKVSIARAIDRESGDWRLWLISARISAKLGDIAAARVSLDRGRELNPRSSVFAP